METASATAGERITRLRGDLALTGYAAERLLWALPNSTHA